MSIETLKREYEIAVRWRAFPLHPDTPEEGRLLTTLFADTPVDIRKMMRQLRETATRLGLPFGDREKTYNSRLAQELGLWAESNGRGDEFHAAAFKAYFVEGKNIAKRPVLLDLAASVNLPIKEATQVLEAGTFKAAVDSDWALSREKEIQAVPTFVVSREILVGAQPYAALAKFIAANGAVKRE